VTERARGPHARRAVVRPTTARATWGVARAGPARRGADDTRRGEPPRGQGDLDAIPARDDETLRRLAPSHRTCATVCPKTG